jgi:hypothetical protein
MIGYGVFKTKSASAPLIDPETLRVDAGLYLLRFAQNEGRLITLFRKLFRSS